MKNSHLPHISASTKSLPVHASSRFEVSKVCQDFIHEITKSVKMPIGT